jgi:hypothetical protein
MSRVSQRLVVPPADRRSCSVVTALAAVATLIASVVASKSVFMGPCPSVRQRGTAPLDLRVQWSDDTASSEAHRDQTKP